MLDTIFQSLYLNIGALETMVIAFVLGLTVTFTYMFTANKEDYDQNLCYTLVIVPVVAAVVIMLIGNSIASALSISGAFALVRFRSEPGSPKNIAYIFATVAIGLACGISYYLCAFIFTVFLCLVMTVLTKLNFGHSSSSKRILKILVPESLDFEDAFEGLIEKHTISHKLVKVSTLDLGSIYELDYKLVMKDTASSKEFIDELRCRNGNLSVSLILDTTREF
ncbi:MAG: DUF4956 domain-containing protein [Clostridia bacterium]|nr:DUF4956 domain-containing protein [Clostridia bacterium]